MKDVRPLTCILAVALSLLTVPPAAAAPHGTSCTNLGLTCVDSDTGTFGGYSCNSYPIGISGADEACWANRDDYGNLQGYVLAFTTIGTARVPTGAFFVRLTVCWGNQDVGSICETVSLPSHSMEKWQWDLDAKYCMPASATAVWTLNGMATYEARSDSPGPFIGSSCP